MKYIIFAGFCCMPALVFSYAIEISSGVANKPKVVDKYNLSGLKVGDTIPSTPPAGQRIVAVEGSTLSVAEENNPTQIMTIMFGAMKPTASKASIKIYRDSAQMTGIEGSFQIENIGQRTAAVTQKQALGAQKAAQETLQNQAQALEIKKPF